MNTHSWGKHAAVLGILILGFSTTLAAQTASTDPWRRVPAAPTSCFANDDFLERLSKTSTEIEADIARQTKLNAEIRERFDNMDMMEKAQRMQAFLMKNPQEAAKVMQGMSASGTSANADLTAAGADGPRLDQEKARHVTNFNAAVDKVVKPLQTRQAEMIKTRTKMVGEAGYAFVSAADQAQYLALVQQENAEYEKACAPFWGPTGAFPSWMASYKTNVTNKIIAAQEANDGVIVVQMAIMDTPSGGYRSTATLEGIRNYLNEVRNVYSLRRSRATGQSGELMLTK